MVKKATKGIFFTTAKFIESTRQFISQLILIDGEETAELGGSTTITYDLKHLDSGSGWLLKNLFFNC